jgi:hypothetical protein
MALGERNGFFDFFPTSPQSHPSVWDSFLLPHAVITLGEDVVACVWSYAGVRLRRFAGHRGKGMWSGAVSDDGRMLATGAWSGCEPQFQF